MNELLRDKGFWLVNCTLTRSTCNQSIVYFLATLRHTLLGSYFPRPLKLHSTGAIPPVPNGEIEQPQPGRDAARRCRRGQQASQAMGAASQDRLRDLPPSQGPMRRGEAHMWQLRGHATVLRRPVLSGLGAGD